MRLPLSISVLIIPLGLLLSHCGSMHAGGKPWQEEVNRELRVLGERNWIVIAEPSFSAMSAPGAKTIIADEPAMDVLYYVLDTLDSQSHANPKIQVPLELSYVGEDYAPGVTKYRKTLNKLILGRNTLEAQHETLRRLMLDSARNYTVLVIKTSTAVPFSNIFIELDSGYWNNDSQAHLREKMKNVPAPSPDKPVNTTTDPGKKPEESGKTPDATLLKGISI